MPLDVKFESEDVNQVLKEYPEFALRVRAQALERMLLQLGSRVVELEAELSTSVVESMGEDISDGLKTHI